MSAPLLRVFLLPIQDRTQRNEVAEDIGFHLETLRTAMTEVNG